MQYDESDFDEPPMFNVVQIIAMNMVFTSAFFVGLKMAGTSWIMSGFGAWVGGCAATLAVTVSGYLLGARTANGSGTNGGRNKSETDKPNAALVPANITDPMQVWEADRLMELDHVIAQKANVDTERKARRRPPVAMQRMWDEDAEAEADESNIAPRRPVRYDRRQATVAYVGPERRVRQR